MNNTYVLKFWFIISNPKDQDKQIWIEAISYYIIESIINNNYVCMQNADSSLFEICNWWFNLCFLLIFL